MPATTFDKPMFPGTKYVKKTITVSNTSGSYSETFYDERITGGLEAARLEIANPEVLDADPHIICYNGYFVFNCDDVEGTTTIKIYFLKVTDDPTAVTSSEFDILNNRITAIENVESRFNITISPSDFSVSAPFTYTWLNSAIKTNSSVKVEFGDGDVDELFGILGFEKVTGGIQFEADILPEDDIQVTVKVMNAGGINAVEVTGEEVATSVISGASNVDEALTALDSKSTWTYIDEITNNGSKQVDITGYEYVLLILCVKDDQSNNYRLAGSSEYPLNLASQYVDFNVYIRPDNETIGARFNATTSVLSCFNGGRGLLYAR